MSALKRITAPLSTTVALFILLKKKLFIVHSKSIPAEHPVIFKPLNSWLRPNLMLSLEHVAAGDEATPSNKIWKQKNPDLFFMVSVNLARQTAFILKAAGWCLDSTK